MISQCLLTKDKQITNFYNSSRDFSIIFDASHLKLFEKYVEKLQNTSTNASLTSFAHQCVQEKTRGQQH
jgi:hypothetical protein